MTTRSTTDLSSNLPQIGLVHARKVHQKSFHSPLSAEAPVQDYRGFHNLVMLLLFVNNLRLVVENYLKYGLLISLPEYDGLSKDLKRCLFALLWPLIPVIVIFLVEIVVARSLGIKKPSKAKSEDVGAGAGVTLHSKPVHGSPDVQKSRTNSGHTLLLPPKSTTPTWAKCVNSLSIMSIAVLTNIYIFYEIKTPFVAALPCFWSMILLMKLTSYVLVNSELRSMNYSGLSTLGLSLFILLHA
jgi:diacylglycerol O-acyltransferase 1